jgi:phage minor structural protein
MITIYDKNETSFTHNGLGVLDNHIIEPIVHEELNGLFSLAFDYPIHGSNAKFLLAENIVKAPVPDMPDQLFRIAERSDAQGTLLHIVAHHIFYDLAKNLIEDTFIVNKTGTQALQQLLANTQFIHPFTGTSNISHVDNARLVRLNPVEILLDAELDNGFLARFGGEIVRDNFHISMLSKRGSNNGVQIRDQKNLIGYKSDVDYSSIITRIMPESADGFFLPEKYVDSPLINTYTSPKIKVIKYDVKVGTDEGQYETKALAYLALRKLAQAEFDSNNIDKPIATYEVKFAPLEKTEEYKDFARLETVNIGDTVQVIHEEDGLNVTARMTSYQYNPMTKAYISVTLGNVMPKFTDIAKDIKKVDTKVDRAQDEANFALTAANGKNTNFYGTATPVNPRLGDVWYKENGDKLEMWVYETREGVTQWFPLITDLTQEAVKQAVEQAQSDANIATDKANQAFNDAVNALNVAENASESVETLATRVEQNTSKISLVASGMSNLKGRLTTAESTLIVQAGQIAAKASQTSVDSLTGRISSAESSLTVQAGQIASKASQSSVEALTGRVTSAETLIQQTSNTMLLKVSELQDEIGVPFKVKNWEQGSLNTSDGSEISATNYIRSEFIAVESGEKYISQRRDGTAVSFYYHFYGFTLPYVDYVPVAKQYTEKLTVGTYTNATIVNYLNSKNVETLSITGSVTSNPYASAEDYLAIYKIPLGGRVLPNTITWNGRKDTSDNIVLIYVGGSWQQIDTVTNSSNALHTWNLTDEQKAAMTGDNLYVAFFSIKNGSYAGIYNATTSPFTLNPMDESAYVQVSYTNSSGAVTVPSNALKMRVRVNTTTKPDEYDGNVFTATARADYSKANTVYSAILMQKDIINLRVGKGDVINQINLSPESILIAGNKVHITGQTTIDNAVITSAMIKDMSITNAKIADATIASAKIAALDAAKITTGTLNAARIAASSITVDKISATNLAAISSNLGTITAGAIDASKVTVTNLNADNIKSGTIIGRTIKTASSGNRIELQSGLDKIYFTGSYTNGSITANINPWNDSLFGRTVMGIDTDWYVNKAVHVNHDMHALGIKATNNVSWKVSLNGRTVNGHGGVSLLDDTNKYGIHITAAEVYFIRNNTWFSLGDVLRGATWNV